MYMHIYRYIHGMKQTIHVNNEIDLVTIRKKNIYFFSLCLKELIDFAVLM